jgi:hypothetical protein
VTNTSRQIVRNGIAQFFGGSTYDTEARAYRPGPLLAYGLSTVRAYQPKRMPDSDYTSGQAAGRGMGAVMIVELPADTESRDAKPAVRGMKRITYLSVLHFFHMAWQPHAEDAEQDVDLLIEQVKQLVRGDVTLGGICFQAGESRMGIRVRIFPSWQEEERTVTAFDVTFEAEVEIIG